MDLNYDMPLYRPPSEGGNLIIQATLGCSFNQCSFCSMYREKQYSERPLETVFEDIHHAVIDRPDARLLNCERSSPIATANFRPRPCRSMRDHRH